MVLGILPHPRLASLQVGWGHVLSPVAVAKIRLAVGPPTLWAEVFSRPDGRWLPVDPVRGIVNRAVVFEERDKAGRKKSNKLVYVVAMEEGKFIVSGVWPEKNKHACVRTMTPRGRKSSEMALGWRRRVFRISEYEKAPRLSIANILSHRSSSKRTL